MTEKQKLAKFAVFFFLVAIFFIRLLIQNDEIVWIQLINYTGVGIAGADLYFKCYTKEDKFKIVTGISAILVVAFVVGAALMLTNIWCLDSRQNDLFTIAALLISLPSDLYAFWIRKYVKR